MPIFLGNKIKDIVWLQTAFLGDIVISTAAFELVKSEFPNCRQHLITTPIGAAALKDHKDLDSIISVDKKKLTFFKTLGLIKKELKDSGVKNSESVLLQPHMSHRSSLLAKLLQIKTVTFSESNFAFLADSRIDRVAVFHEAERVAMLTTQIGVSRSKILGIRPNLTAIDLPATAGWQTQLSETDVTWVGVCPGSVWGTKRWPAEHYTNLIRKFRSNHKIKFVLMGSGDEKIICDQIETDLQGDNILNLAGKTNLDELRMIYPKLKLLIANDSSAIHYAASFNVPTLAIFGATVPEMGFSPLADSSRIAEIKSLECRPCSDHGPVSCPLGHFDCMKKLLPDQVKKLADEMLKICGNNN